MNNLGNKQFIKKGIKRGVVMHMFRNNKSICYKLVKNEFHTIFIIKLLDEKFMMYEIVIQIFQGGGATL